ncbi:hypothetical protein JCM14469_39240 [Desulfatiferula olefinivorans]
MKKIILFFSLLFVFAACSSDSHHDSSNLFSEATRAAFKTSVDDSLAAATYNSGISVAVYKDGYAMWTYAAGNAETGVDMTTSTPGYAYSITKTMVSALILSQIEDGLYSLDDTVDDLLNDQADYGSFNTTNINVDATVEQLLNHTSGMPDYAANLTPLLAMCNPAYTTWKPADILNNIVFLPFNVAAGFQYSNTNYILLGMIAEHMGGDTLNSLLSDQFFNILGIDACLAPQDPIPYTTIAHPYDDAYIFGDGTTPPLGTFMDMSLALFSVYPTFNYYDGVGRGTWAAGGIISTPNQLARWGFELYDADGDAVTSDVRTEIKDSAPADNTYGYGVGYDDFTYDDGTIGGLYGHGGSAPGYKNVMRYEKNQRITVVIMTNANNSTTGLDLVDLDGLVEDILNDFKDNNE